MGALLIIISLPIAVVCLVVLIGRAVRRER
jgi:hypothetical protein